MSCHDALLCFKVYSVFVCSSLWTAPVAGMLALLLVCHGMVLYCSTKEAIFIIVKSGQEIFTRKLQEIHSKNAGLF